MIQTQSLKKVDAHAKVTGEALYPGDITPEALLHGKVLFSNQPHARMVSIDLSEALAVPGVITILTAEDVPLNEYGLIVPDQPVLVGLNSDKPYSDVSRWEGDQVAVIIAETETAAAIARVVGGSGGNVASGLLPQLGHAVFVPSKESKGDDG